MVFYEKYLELCAKKGVTPHKAALENGLSSATATKWKKTGATPSGATLEKLSSYFGCTIEYLLDKEPSENKKESPPADSREAEDMELLKRIQSLSETQRRMVENLVLSYEEK